jgi:hypothetical protein
MNKPRMNLWFIAGLLVFLVGLALKFTGAWLGFDIRAVYLATGAVWLVAICLLRIGK